MKKITGYIKLQLPAGKANPSPPVGPALGQHGVNIMAFCKEFNARTQSQDGTILPVEVTIYSDKSFTFITKVKLRSEYTVMTTGMIMSPCAALLALKSLQKAMMLTPCWPSAGPTGGDGFALPAGSCNLT